jgi:hypothetical protein
VLGAIGNVLASIVQFIFEIPFVRWVVAAGLIVLVGYAGYSIFLSGGDDDFPSQNLITGDVFVSSTEVRRVTDADSATLSNCQGTETLITDQPFTKQVSGEIVIESSAANPPLTKNLRALVRGAVADQLKSTTQDEIVSALSVSARVPAGSKGTYKVQWVETYTTGVVEVVGKDDVYFYKFLVPLSINGDQQEPVLADCK